jgi:caa(3)-type oxidase subunit IV
MNDRAFRRHVRSLFIAWVALILLLLASFGSSYVPMGMGNAIVSTVIAVIKAAIVVALFMGLLRPTPLLRIVAAAALGTWCILLALAGLDEVTRAHLPAQVQEPQQRVK